MWLLTGVTPLLHLCPSQDFRHHTTESSTQTEVPYLQKPEFDSDTFMDKFKNRFLNSVDSRAIVLRLEIDKVISKDVAHNISRCATDTGNEKLFLHLRNYANPDSISKLCDVMMGIAGYPRMSGLGRAMKEELDLLTSRSS